MPEHAVAAAKNLGHVIELAGMSGLDQSYIDLLGNRPPTPTWIYRGGAVIVVRSGGRSPIDAV